MVGIFETNILKECESVNTACSSAIMTYRLGDKILVDTL